MIKEYLKNLQTTMNRGDAREESYYKHLENLIKVYTEANNIKKIDVTILPKKTEAGNPDFRIWDGKYHITGYIEAKYPSVKNLDWIEDTEQLKRYRSTFPNVILTNFYEFRLYRDGKLIDKVSIGRPILAQKLKTAPPLENEKEFFHLLEMFFSFSMPAIRSAKSLALELARRTCFLRDEVIALELEEEQREGRKAVLGFYEAFKQYLIGTLTQKQFADLYAQTITYGLFAARTRAEDNFNREMAFKYIPKTIGILRDVFRFISLEDPPKALQVIVDDIAGVLQATDVKKILHDYFIEGKGKDPIIHFYETFLAAYDPKTRERRGVYYTPEPVVRYIVRAIHSILKSHFGLKDGFASPEVTVLDPAAGTLTFPAEAVKLAVEEYVSKYGEGGKHKLIKNQILKNFYAFELMMAPYAIGHLKMSFLFEELGYKLQDDERFNLYLTNALEMDDLSQTVIPGLGSLSEESHLAGKVKKDQPILVILGNPPYSGISANINDWTEKLLKEDIDGAQSYYKVDGKPLGEKKVWLQDDYVKFLRFAQWKIQKAGHGIVGMITNHSYLDNPTFRGMRQSLMNTFDEIYILDLHGNSLKKETAPNGSKDENVFDIRQGVAIVLFVKGKKKEKRKIYQTDLYGTRESKYEWLENSEFSKNIYGELKPDKPWYFFIQRNTSEIMEYLNWPRINEIFPVNVTGIVTARDKFVIGFDKNEIKNRILQFRNFSLSDEIIKQTYNLKDTRGWKISVARKKILEDSDWNSYYQKILYRPFDIRTIYYTDKMVDWGRPEVMRHMLEENIAICFMRQFSGNMPYTHCLITENIVDNRTFFSSKGIIQQAPLYIYPKENKNLFNQHQTSRQPNIVQKLLEQLTSVYNMTPSPEAILHYIYGVLYSPTYREKYAEFLKIDFPRIPFTEDNGLSIQMSLFGDQLAQLHLLKSPALDSPIAKYQGSGENDTVDKVRYEAREQRVYINPDKYFEGVAPEVWNYRIGGYQVCHKWLKDRKGRLLSLEEQKTYCKIVTALEKTIGIQREIDRIFQKIEENDIITLSSDSQTGRQ